MWRVCCVVSFSFILVRILLFGNLLLFYRDLAWYGSYLYIISCVRLLCCWSVLTTMQYSAFFLDSMAACSRIVGPNRSALNFLSLVFFT